MRDNHRLHNPFHFTLEELTKWTFPIGALALLPMIPLACIYPAANAEAKGSLSHPCPSALQCIGTAGVASSVPEWLGQIVPSAPDNRHDGSSIKAFDWPTKIVDSARPNCTNCPPPRIQEQSKTFSASTERSSASLHHATTRKRQSTWHTESSRAKLHRNFQKARSSKISAEYSGCHSSIRSRAIRILLKRGLKRVLNA